MKDPEQFKYKAFISHNHTADEKLAPALQLARYQLAKLEVLKDQGALTVGS